MNHSDFSKSFYRVISSYEVFKSYVSEIFHKPNTNYENNLSFESNDAAEIGGVHLRKFLNNVSTNTSEVSNSFPALDLNAALVERFIEVENLKSIECNKYNLNSFEVSHEYRDFDFNSEGKSVVPLSESTQLRIVKFSDNSFSISIVGLDGDKQVINSSGPRHGYVYQAHDLFLSKGVGFLSNKGVLAQGLKENLYFTVKDNNDELYGIHCSINGSFEESVQNNKKNLERRFVYPHYDPRFIKPKSFTEYREVSTDISIENPVFTISDGEKDNNNLFNQISSRFLHGKVLISENKLEVFNPINRNPRRLRSLLGTKHFILMANLNDYGVTKTILKEKLINALDGSLEVTFIFNKLGADHQASGLESEIKVIQQILIGEELFVNSKL